MQLCGNHSSGLRQWGKMDLELYFCTSHTTNRVPIPLWWFSLLLTTQKFLRGSSHWSALPAWPMNGSKINWLTPAGNGMRLNDISAWRPALTLFCFVCHRRRRLRGSRGAWESCVRCARPEQQPERHEGGHASESIVHPARPAAAANACWAVQGAPTPTPPTTAPCR